MAIALTIGTLLAVAALCYVLYPLFFGVPATPRADARRIARLEDVSPRREAIAVLREIEFDRATGKLAETDYAELKTQWTQRALEAQRAEDAVGAGAVGAVAVETTPAAEDTSDPVELAIRRARANVARCPVDGPRPEPDALYCSDCGRWLTGACSSCGAPVPGEGARFCAECGTSLAA
jgi:hypothetical protein